MSITLTHEPDDNEWEDYHEPLARIYREVRNTLPSYKVDFKNATMTEKVYVLMRDIEVKTEFETLLRQIITEVENEQE